MYLNLRKAIHIGLIAVFALSCPNVPPVMAEQIAVPAMPAPGTMVNLSPAFVPAHLKGITIHPDNALQFDFLVHKGDENLDEAHKQDEYNKLVKYFLASLTVPDKDQWVNLSPYEKDRIIENNFGKTEMGRDLLSQDYLLKQITSSLMYPESGLGKAFWDKVYARAAKEFGTTDIPVDTFNKVWIVPDKAVVYENGNTAYVMQSHLKVMLEEDYVALNKNNKRATPPRTSTQVIREVLLPELEREVNEGKNFAMLRQIYSAMILATWYKKALKESLLGKVYADKARVKGVDQDPKANEEIYQKYLAAFKKGVYNYIKEDLDPATKQVVPRKYFAGGFEDNVAQIMDRAQVSQARLSAAMREQDFSGKGDVAMVALDNVMDRRGVLGILGRAVAAAALAATPAVAQGFIVDDAQEEQEALDILAHSKLLERKQITVAGRPVNVFIIESMTFTYTEPAFVKGNNVFIALENMRRHVRTVLGREQQAGFLSRRELFGDASTADIIRAVIEATWKHEIIHLFTNPGITGGRTLTAYRVRQEFAGYTGEIAFSRFPKALFNELIAAQLDAQDLIMSGAVSAILENLLPRLGFIDYLAARLSGSPAQARQSALEQFRSRRYAQQALLFLRDLSGEEIRRRARETYESEFGPLPDLAPFQPAIDEFMGKYGRTFTVPARRTEEGIGSEKIKLKDNSMLGSVTVSTTGDEIRRMLDAPDMLLINEVADEDELNRLLEAGRTVLAFHGSFRPDVKPGQRVPPAVILQPSENMSADGIRLLTMGETYETLLETFRRLLAEKGVEYPSRLNSVYLTSSIEDATVFGDVHLVAFKLKGPLPPRRYAVKWADMEKSAILIKNAIESLDEFSREMGYGRYAERNMATAAAYWTQKAGSQTSHRELLVDPGYVDIVSLGVVAKGQESGRPLAELVGRTRADRAMTASQIAQRLLLATAILGGEAATLPSYVQGEEVHLPAESLVETIFLAGSRFEKERFRFAGKDINIYFVQDGVRHPSFKEYLSFAYGDNVVINLERMRRFAGRFLDDRTAGILDRLDMFGNKDDRTVLAEIVQEYIWHEVVHIFVRAAINRGDYDKTSIPRAALHEVAAYLKQLVFSANPKMALNDLAAAQYDLSRPIAHRMAAGVIAKYLLKGMGSGSVLNYLRSLSDQKIRDMAGETFRSLYGAFPDLDEAKARPLFEEVIRKHPVGDKAMTAQTNEDLQHALEAFPMLGQALPLVGKMVNIKFKGSSVTGVLDAVNVIPSEAVEDSIKIEIVIDGNAVNLFANKRSGKWVGVSTNALVKVAEAQAPSARQKKPPRTGRTEKSKAAAEQLFAVTPDKLLEWLAANDLVLEDYQLWRSAGGKEADFDPYTVTFIVDNGKFTLFPKNRRLAGQHRLLRITGKGHVMDGVRLLLKPQDVQRIGFKDASVGDQAQLATPGGIDLNSANLDLQIKRDKKGVPLPLAQQDLQRLNSIEGFVPVILEIKPASTLPVFNTTS